MTYLNKRSNTKQDLFEIDFTPKGTNEMMTLLVYAENRLAASNFLINRKIWGTVHEVRYNHFASLTKEVQA